MASFILQYTSPWIIRTRFLQTSCQFRTVPKPWRFYLFSRYATFPYNLDCCCSIYPCARHTFLSQKNKHPNWGYNFAQRYEIAIISMGPDTRNFWHKLSASDTLENFLLRENGNSEGIWESLVRLRIKQERVYS